MLAYTSEEKEIIKDQTDTFLKEKGWNKVDSEIELSIPIKEVYIEFHKTTKVISSYILSFFFVIYLLQLGLQVLPFGLLLFVLPALFSLRIKSDIYILNQFKSRASYYLYNKIHFLIVRGTD